jgi:hypothetical protein
LNALGRCGNDARNAACAGVSCSGAQPKYARLARATPLMRLPYGARLRYSARICRFEYRCSSRTASTASAAFSRNDRLFDCRSSFATCCVIVDPPCTTFSARTLCTIARAIAIGSTPGCA